MNKPWEKKKIEEGLGPAQDPAVRFKVGDVVEVRAEDTARRWRKPHVRVPGYIHGCVGTVVEVAGVFDDPAYGAFRDPSPPQPLYRVTFTTAYGALEADIFQPWLTSAVGAQPMPFVAAAVGRMVDHGDHRHDTREDIEKAAVAKEGAPLPLEGLAAVLVDLCVAKGLTTKDRLRATVERLDSLGGPNGTGLRMLVRAWCDPVFKSMLLKDAEGAAGLLGIATSNYGTAADVSTHPGPRRYPPGHTVLKVVENTPRTHNLVVCTLCSCYPTAMLGLAPDWYKSQSYRARAVLYSFSSIKYR